MRASLAQPPIATSTNRQWFSFGSLLLAVALVLLALATVHAISKPDWLDGRDFELYRSATARWLGGGPFYEPYQLAGPYLVSHGDVLYPPVALLLFAPFTVLPAVLWWVLPLAVILWVIYDLRPDRIGLALVVLCVAWPPTLTKLSTGNPVMWSVAAVALGVRFPGPAVFVLLKPSLAPFALVGVSRRNWWLALGGLALLSLPFGLMWLDWLTSLRNAQDGGILYSITDLPMMALAIFADVRRTTRRRRTAAPTAPARSSPG
jgi:hypothetical protein